MKFKALFNNILQNERLAKTTILYKDANELDKATIVEAIINYIVRV